MDSIPSQPVSAGQLTFESMCNTLRAQIKVQANILLDFKKNVQASETTTIEDRGEVLANLTLTYRHLEDASMRLGKAIQAHDGGVSVYDKSTTVGA